VDVSPLPLEMTRSDYAVIKFGFFLAIIVGLGYGLSQLIGGEREGVVKIDDCREVVQLPDNPYQKYYSRFTCEYEKTTDGRIKSGTCVHASTNFFTGSCSKASVYKKTPLVKCGEREFIDDEGKCASYDAGWF